MKKLTVYLDTSVINFLYAEDVPDFRRMTEDFFNCYAARYALYGSDVLLRELHADSNAERLHRHLSVLRTHAVSILLANPANCISSGG